MATSTLGLCVGRGCSNITRLEKYGRPTNTLQDGLSPRDELESIFLVMEACGLGFERSSTFLHVVVGVTWEKVISRASQL